jgi:hypothetical protein
MLENPKIDLNSDFNTVQLSTDSLRRWLAMANEHFNKIFLFEDKDSNSLKSQLVLLACLVESRAYLPTVNCKLHKIQRTTNRLAKSIVNLVHYVRAPLQETQGYQELPETLCTLSSLFANASIAALPLAAQRPSYCLLHPAISLYVILTLLHCPASLSHLFASTQPLRQPWPSIQSKSPIAAFFFHMDLKHIQ